ncbi:hypothetical protein Droror1_Dr00026599 [Drosera rotundifolia]
MNLKARSTYSSYLPRLKSEGWVLLRFGFVFVFVGAVREFGFVVCGSCDGRFAAVYSSPSLMRMAWVAKSRWLEFSLVNKVWRRYPVLKFLGVLRIGGTSSLEFVWVRDKLIKGDLRCGGIEDAREVCDGLPKRHGVLWNLMNSGYIRQRRSVDAVCSLSRV